MATGKENLTKMFGKDAADKIGTYKESTGGGTPIPAGEKLADHPEAHRVQQPRDDEGKFTYNSVNQKPLKYGPSRGTTTVPFLRGKTMNFVIKKGDKVVYDGKVSKVTYDIDEKQLMDILKVWRADKNDFNGLDDALEAKKGRRSAGEKAAIANKVEGLNADKKAMASTTGYKDDFTISQFLGGKKTAGGFSANQAHWWKKKTNPQPQATQPVQKPVQPTPAPKPQNANNAKQSIFDKFKNRFKKKDSGDITSQLSNDDLASAFNI